MKKLILIVAVGLFLMGCASVKQSEYLSHDSHYKTSSHMKFSWWGYKKVTNEDKEKSTQQKWWGIPY